MAALPLLDIADLIKEISPGKPGGEPLSIALRDQLDEKRQEDDPEEFEPDDPLRPEKFRKADWPGIVELAKATLTQTSKDLEVAARLTEALVKQHGFAGLRDGLRLLRELVDTCWDHLHPAVENGDLEDRVIRLDWLNTGLPGTIRLVPLIFRKGMQDQDIPYSRFHWANESKDPRNQVSREDLEKAIVDTGLERCEAKAQEIEQSLEELNQLDRSLVAKMGRETAPGLSKLRTAVEECHALMQQILKRIRPAPPPKPDRSNGQAQPDPAGSPAAPAWALATRKDAYEQLAQVADLLQNLEPHSPIPYLLRRAVELGELPFPQLIKALIRDANVLSVLNRELGLKEPPPDGQEQT